MGALENIQIVSAPSILGLSPTGVEKLAGSLLSHGLHKKLNCRNPVENIPTLNAIYSAKRDKETNCLNAAGIRDFSLTLGNSYLEIFSKNNFTLVLGGDCSILIGIMPVLKKNGNYGLIFCDAHADFYQPEKSVTGEVADMDLAIVTGRGPELLTDIHNLKPYVADEHVIHIGQRDWEETQQYGSQDIVKSAIHCINYETFREAGILAIIQKIKQKMASLNTAGFWIHFDTDFLADEENPAVDYRLPGGVPSEQCVQLFRALMSTNKIVGMSVTIFNPDLDDEQNTVAQMLTQLITRSIIF